MILNKTEYNIPFVWIPLVNIDTNLTRICGMKVPRLRHQIGCVRKDGRNRQKTAVEVLVGSAGNIFCKSDAFLNGFRHGYNLCCYLRTRLLICIFAVVISCLHGDLLLQSMNALTMETTSDPHYIPQRRVARKVYMDLYQTDSHHISFLLGKGRFRKILTFFLISMFFLLFCPSV